MKPSPRSIGEPAKAPASSASRQRFVRADFVDQRHEAVTRRLRRIRRYGCAGQRRPGGCEKISLPPIAFAVKSDYFLVLGSRSHLKNRLPLGLAMLSHDRIWAAIDRLAERYGMSASGLARKAGLDATSFNRSKRTSPDGRDRWPSTESVAKVLRATGASLDEFMRLIEPGVEPRQDHDPAHRHDAGRRRPPLHRRRHADRRAGLGGGRVPRPVEREGLRARGPGRFDAAALPRRRHPDRLADARTRARATASSCAPRAARSRRRRSSARRRRASSCARSTPSHPDRAIPASEIAWMARVMWARQ